MGTQYEAFWEISFSDWMLATVEEIIGLMTAQIKNNRLRTVCRLQQEHNGYGGRHERWATAVYAFQQAPECGI